MHCLQDLQLRWTVVSAWRQNPLLIGLNISSVINLQVPDYWCLTGRHHTHLAHSIVELHPVIIQHCCAFQVRINMNCNLWTNLSLTHFGFNRMNMFCCFITIAAQITLSPSTDWARYSLKHGIKQPHQPTLKQHSCHWHLVLQSLAYSGQNLRSQFCNT